MVAFCTNGLGGFLSQCDIRTGFHLELRFPSASRTRTRSYDPVTCSVSSRLGTRTMDPPGLNDAEYKSLGILWAISVVERGSGWLRVRFKPANGIDTETQAVQEQESPENCASEKGKLKK